MAEGRIPTIISEFNGFVNETDDDLLVVVPPSTQPNWQRLGLLAAQQAIWHAGRVAWQSLYALYLNPATRTPVVVKQIKEFMKTTQKTIGPMLYIMAASPNATARDEEVYHFVRPSNRKKPTRPTGEIYELCYAKIISRGAGVMQFKCSSEQDANRASMPPHTGVVEVLCKVVDIVPDPTHESLPPTDFNDPTLNIRATFTKASFALELGGGVKGKYLEGFVRWIDAHNPKRLGQWTAITNTVIT